MVKNDYEWFNGYETGRVCLASRRTDHSSKGVHGLRRGWPCQLATRVMNLLYYLCFIFIIFHFSILPFIYYKSVFLKFALDCKNVFENSTGFADVITWETELLLSAHIVINRWINSSKCIGWSFLPWSNNKRWWWNWPITWQCNVILWKQSDLKCRTSFRLTTSSGSGIA